MRLSRVLLAVSVSGILGTSVPSYAQEKTTPPTPAKTEKLQPYTEILPKSVVKVQMMPIPGGTIKVGTQNVTVKPFWIANTETPWEAFDVFVASGPPSPSYGMKEIAPDAIALPSKSYILPDLGWGHNGYPVINVSFLNVSMYCRWMSSVTGKKYRLPTEAEWEIACRAGNNTPWKQMDKVQANKVAWYAANSENTTHPVGKKLPNKFGLYDMFGNTGEWATDVAGKPVVCGGTYLDNPDRLNPTIRRYQTKKWQETDPQFPKSRWWLSDGRFIGFRVVCEP